MMMLFEWTESDLEQCHTMSKGQYWASPLFSVANVSGFRVKLYPRGRNRNGNSTETDNSDDCSAARNVPDVNGGTDPNVSNRRDAKNFHIGTNDKGKSMKRIPCLESNDDGLNEYSSIFLHGPSHVRLSFEFTIDGTTKRCEQLGSVAAGFGWYEFTTATKSYRHVKLQVYALEQIDSVAWNVSKELLEINNFPLKSPGFIIGGISGLSIRFFPFGSKPVGKAGEERDSTAESESDEVGDLTEEEYESEHSANDKEDVDDDGEDDEEDVDDDEEAVDGEGDTVNITSSSERDQEMDSKKDHAASCSEESRYASIFVHGPAAIRLMFEIDVDGTRRVCKRLGAVNAGRGWRRFMRAQRHSEIIVIKILAVETEHTFWWSLRNAAADSLRLGSPLLSTKFACGNVEGLQLRMFPHGLPGVGSDTSMPDSGTDSSPRPGPPSEGCSRADSGEGTKDLAAGGSNESDSSEPEEFEQGESKGAATECVGSAQTGEASTNGQVSLTQVARRPASILLHGPGNVRLSFELEINGARRVCRSLRAVNTGLGWRSVGGLGEGGRPSFIRLQMLAAECPGGFWWSVRDVPCDTMERGERASSPKFACAGLPDLRIRFYPRGASRSAEDCSSLWLKSSVKFRGTIDARVNDVTMRIGKFWRGACSSFGCDFEASKEHYRSVAIEFHAVARESTFWWFVGDVDLPTRSGEFVSSSAFSCAGVDALRLRLYPAGLSADRGGGGEPANGAMAAAGNVVAAGMSALPESEVESWNRPNLVVTVRGPCGVRLLCEVTMHKSKRRVGELDVFGAAGGGGAVKTLATAEFLAEGEEGPVAVLLTVLAVARPSTFWWNVTDEAGENAMSGGDLLRSPSFACAGVAGLSIRLAPPGSSRSADAGSRRCLVSTDSDDEPPQAVSLLLFGPVGVRLSFRAELDGAVKEKESLLPVLAGSGWQYFERKGQNLGSLTITMLAVENKGSFWWSLSAAAAASSTKKLSQQMLKSPEFCSGGASGLFLWVKESEREGTRTAKLRLAMPPEVTVVSAEVGVDSQTRKLAIKAALSMHAISYEKMWDSGLLSLPPDSKEVTLKLSNASFSFPEDLEVHEKLRCLERILEHEGSVTRRLLNQAILDKSIRVRRRVQGMVDAELRKCEHPRKLIDAQRRQLGELEKQQQMELDDMHRERKDFQKRAEMAEKKMDEVVRQLEKKLAAQVERSRRCLHQAVMRPFSYTRSRVCLLTDEGGVRREIQEGTAVRVGAGLILAVELCDEWDNEIACNEVRGAAAAQLQLWASLAISAAQFHLDQGAGRIYGSFYVLESGSCVMCAYIGDRTHLLCREISVQILPRLPVAVKLLGNSAAAPLPERESGRGTVDIYDGEKWQRTAQLVDSEGGCWKDGQAVSAYLFCQVSGTRHEIAVRFSELGKRAAEDGERGGSDGGEWSGRFSLSVTNTGLRGMFELHVLVADIGGDVDLQLPCGGIQMLYSRDPRAWSPGDVVLFLGEWVDGLGPEPLNDEEKGVAVDGAGLLGAGAEYYLRFLLGVDRDSGDADAEQRQRRLRGLQGAARALDTLHLAATQRDARPTPLAAVPEQFRCPLTLEVMVDPVSTEDGQVYERVAIESWLESHNTSPSTNAVLPSKRLIPNLPLRALIREFVAAVPAGAAPPSTAPPNAAP